MPRSIWSGSISFGLVNIPVSLVTAKESEPISFHLLDRRDHSRIGYRTINKATGKEVTRDQIVKGYEIDKDEFVIVSEKDFEKANPKATKTIDVEEFVSADELDPLLLEKPYYLIPAKSGEKGYALFKRILLETNKVAIARFVLRQKQKLVAILPRGNYLVLEVMRYAREVLSPHEMEKVDERLQDVKLSKKEVDMAEALVESMTGKWDPERYRDTYSEDLLSFIRTKAKKGEAVAAAEAPDADFRAPSGVIDLMPLLQKSLDRKKGDRKKTGGKREARSSKKKISPSDRHAP